MKNKGLLIFILTLTAWLSACTDTNSGDLFTSDICASINVTSSDISTMRVETHLTSDCLPFHPVELTCGDNITVTYAGKTQQLKASPNIVNDVTYYTNLSDYLDSTDLNVSLIRSGDKVDAPNSTVTLPKSFTIVNNFYDTYSSSDTLTIDWVDNDNTGSSTADTTVTISCDKTSIIDTKTGETQTDTLSNYVNQTDVPPIQAQLSSLNDFPNDYNECTGSILISRRTTGTADSNFRNGSTITATYNYEHTFTFNR